MANCESIIREATDMALEYQNNSSIIYKAENIGAIMALVENDITPSNVVTCEEGCTCNVVNSAVLRCLLDGRVVDPSVVGFQ